MSKQRIQFTSPRIAGYPYRLFHWALPLRTMVCGSDQEGVSQARNEARLRSYRLEKFDPCLRLRAEAESFLT